MKNRETTSLQLSPTLTYRLLKDLRQILQHHHRKLSTLLHNGIDPVDILQREWAKLVLRRLPGSAASAQRAACSLNAQAEHIDPLLSMSKRGCSMPGLNYLVGNGYGYLEFEHLVL